MQPHAIATKGVHSLQFLMVHARLLTPARDAVWKERQICSASSRYALNMPHQLDARCVEPEDSGPAIVESTYVTGRA